MLALFYISALVAIISSIGVITSKNAVHALLYMILSLIAVSIVIFLYGAPFAGILEIIIYAGAIMVLFFFVIMLLNQGRRTVEQERPNFKLSYWIAPLLLSLVLLGEILFCLFAGHLVPPNLDTIMPKAVGMELFGPYLLAVELAGMLLLTGLIGAYTIGRKQP